MVSYQDGPHNFDRWIAYATVGLTPNSQNRVRAELTAHFEEACQAKRDAGCAADVAQAEVLRTLGDPLEANRGFRKVYLCDTDLEKIKYFRSLYPFPMNWRTSIVATIIGYAIVFVSFYLISKNWGIFLLRNILGMIAIDFIVLFRRVILAYFMFTPERKGVERRFKAAVFAGYGLIGLSIILSLSGMMIYGIIIGSGHLQMIILAVVIFLTILTCALFIARELTIFIPLLRKIKELPEAQSSPTGSDQHA